MLELAFWSSVGLIVYVYAGYPLLLILVGSIRNHSVAKRDITPRLSLVITAYNEQEHIGGRLENALSLDYPGEALEIIVASDGSTDRTAAIVERFADRGVTLLRFPRQGKIHALNAAVEYASGEIVVFSDATSTYNPQALRKLARNFADPEVGAVTGRPQFVPDSRAHSTAHTERAYFNYDCFLKKMESRTGSVVSGSGCIHAIRRELYRPIPAYVADDITISTASIVQGKRLVFEEEAVAFEEPAKRSRGEFQRKVRMMTRGFRSLVFRRRLFNPFQYGFYSVVLLSHKLLRRLVPLFLLTLLAVSAASAIEKPFYGAALAAQAGFYLLACAGALLTDRPIGRAALLAIPFYYCVANGAALVALSKVLRGVRIEQWNPDRSY